MKLKIKSKQLLIWGLITSLFLILIGSAIVFNGNPAFATPGNTSACTNCHGLQAGSLRVTTDTATKTVAPGASFAISISYTGGGSSRTEINWPNVQNNTLFAPTPRVPFSAMAGTATAISTLTAPAAPGTYTVRVFATQSVPTMETDYKDISITVSTPPAAPTITTTSLASGTVGSAYSQSLAATGGAAPYTWSLSAGSLPSGLTLSSAGVISGNPATAATTGFTVMVTDSASATATRALSILINTPTDTTGPLTSNILVTPNPSAGASSVSLTATINDTATGGSNITAAEYFIDAVSLNGSGTAMSGTFTSANVNVSASINASIFSTGSHSVYVHGKDAANNWGSSISASFSVTAAPIALSVTTASLPAGTLGTAYSQNLAATGGTAPYTWSLSAGALPSGLALSSAGVISGNPAAAGTTNFTVRATDALSANATRALSILVNPAPIALSVTTASLPAGTVGTAYSQNLAATGGTVPYTWSLSAGALPSGLALSSAGVISGNPAAAGTANFTVRATDALSATATRALSILVNPAPIALSVTTASLPAGTVSTAYSQNLAATGGTAPYTWSLSAGALPSGLALSSAGVISGNPAAAVTANFTVMVTDSASANASRALSILINPAAPPPAPGTDNTGPLTGRLRISNEDGKIKLSALVSDVKTGNARIVAAEYFIDAVGPDGTGKTMKVSHESEDSNTLISATLDLRELKSGAHTLYVHAKDSSGNWGQLVSVTVQNNRHVDRHGHEVDD